MPAQYSTETCIATTTLYNPDSENDRVRSNLALETLRKALDLGYQVILVDGGSSDELLKEFERYGASVHQESGGMGGERRKVFSLAQSSGKPVIAWLEPEKVNYLSQLEKTIAPVINGDADLVIPQRKSLASYPLSQQECEPLGNQAWKEITGLDLDLWFGPRTMNQDTSILFSNYNGEFGDKWDSIFIPVMDAVHQGKKVIGVPIDYTHPKSQTESEEGNADFKEKREMQLRTLVDMLETHWGRLIG